MTDPFVSVVIPAFEPGPLIDATLESVLAQTWRRREVIVVDDGSRDDTPQRVARYAGRISYLRLEREGGGAARNAGVRAARGDYVAFLDHDDLCRTARYYKTSPPDPWQCQRVRRGRGQRYV